MAARTEPHSGWVFAPWGVAGVLLLYVAGYGPSISLEVRYPSCAWLGVVYEPLPEALKHTIRDAWIKVDPGMLMNE